MCYYMGIRYSRADFLRLMEIQMELENLNRPVQKGFDYKDWPVVLPMGNGKTVIKNVHWEYIPRFVRDEIQLKAYRKKKTWLNAQSEHLFLIDGKPSMWKEGAENGRCLALASYFFEYQHTPKIGKKGQLLKATDKQAYCVAMADGANPFYIAAISRVWIDETRNKSENTFALVTTKANELMAKIHNSKMRMPTMLPKELALEWIQPGLSKERIMEIASYQIPSESLTSWKIEANILQPGIDPITPEILEHLHIEAA